MSSQCKIILKKNKNRDLIQIQKFIYRKERILYSARTSQRCMKLAREIFTALLWGSLPHEGAVFLREGNPNCREIDGLKLKLKAFKIS